MVKLMCFTYEMMIFIVLKTGNVKYEGDGGHIPLKKVFTDN